MGVMVMGGDFLKLKPAKKPMTMGDLSHIMDT